MLAKRMVPNLSDEQRSLLTIINAALRHLPCVAA
jgi:hypothetical protein